MQVDESAKRAYEMGEEVIQVLHNKDFNQLTVLVEAWKLFHVDVSQLAIFN